jgi:hypothetical protein
MAGLSMIFSKNQHPLLWIMLYHSQIQRHPLPEARRMGDKRTTVRERLRLTAQGEHGA